MKMLRKLLYIIVKPFVQEAMNFEIKKFYENFLQKEFESVAEQIAKKEIDEFYKFLIEQQENTKHIESIGIEEEIELNQFAIEALSGENAKIR